MKLLPALILSLSILPAAFASTDNQRSKSYPGSVDEEPLKVQEELEPIHVTTQRAELEAKARKELFKAKEEAEKKGKMQISN